MSEAVANSVGANTKLFGQTGGYLAGCDGTRDIWVFAYGSLIWRPSFAWEERRLVTLPGHHRALCLWSHDHRGSPDVPGLVFGLKPGGSCRGIAYRIAASLVEDTLQALWTREMSCGAYLPRWVRCHQDGRTPVTALAFMLNRGCDQYTGELSPEDQLRVIRQAVGMSGPCIDYVVQTHAALNQHGIRDKNLCRLVQLLRQTEALVPQPDVLGGWAGALA